jgi:hypothetical protein
MLAGDHSTFIAGKPPIAGVPTYALSYPRAYTRGVQPDCGRSSLSAPYNQLIFFNISCVTKALRVKVLSMKVLHNF